MTSFYLYILPVSDTETSTESYKIWLSDKWVFFFFFFFIWIQVPDLVVHEEEVYEDEDDENAEGNWRNDYPDEESDADSDREERYGGEN